MSRNVAGATNPSPGGDVSGAAAPSAGSANRFATGATLTHASARAALAAGLQRIASGATGVDCAALSQFDSSALAVLLAWRRAGETRGVQLDIVNLPAGLSSLAHAYGIDALLGARH